MIEVTVIIATLGLREREREIERAIASVVNQVGVNLIPLIVLNGNRYDPEIRTRLEQRSDVRFLYTPKPSVSNARYLGRQNVETPFFAFLDDDDEFLPSGLADLLAVFRGNSEVDVVVSPGYVETAGKRTADVFHMDIWAKDLAAGLLTDNWLTPNGGLYRTSSVSETYFRDLPDIFEWTYLGIQFALTLNVLSCKELTFVKHEGSAEQAKASPRYYREAPIVLARIAKFPLSAPARSVLRARYSAALHYAANKDADNGQIWSAWKYHLRSVFCPSGFKYFSYTRHLISASLSQAPNDTGV